MEKSHGIVCSIIIMSCVERDFTASAVCRIGNKATAAIFAPISSPERRSSVSAQKSAGPRNLQLLAAVRARMALPTSVLPSFETAPVVGARLR